MPDAPVDLGPGRPELERAPAAPRSRAFDDVYFSADDGLAEAEAVFLAGCGLPDAWSKSSGRRAFVIGELGFGSGLNLVAALALWRRTRPPGGRLHFVSVEGFPLDTRDAAALLEAFPDARDAARSVLDVWPPRIKGVHRRRLDADGVTVTIAHLEALEALAALEFTADAWFLDGFAPARNAAMWRPEVLAAVAARSRPGARLATFTVAGAVRRGLTAVGFDVAKRPGHGAKRERLEAVFQPTGGRPPRHAAVSRAPMYPRASCGGLVLVIGAGIAGASVARALVRRGIETTVLDAGATLGQGASGNPIALIAPRLDLDDRPAARFHRAAYAYALAEYAASDAFHPIGVVRAAKDDADGRRLVKLYEAEALPGDMLSPVSPLAALIAETTDAPTAARTSGVRLPQAGTLEPSRWLESALAGARLLHGVRVARLDHDGALWSAYDADGATLARAPCCVLAAGPALARFAPTAHVPLAFTRGQLTLAAVDGDPPSHAATWGPYLAPTPDGRLAFGATHDAVAADDPVLDAPLVADASSDARNRAALSAFAPGLAAQINPSSEQGRAAVRAGTPDRLPVAGAAVDAAAFARRFSGLAHGRADAAADPKVCDSEPWEQKGLYVLGGLGGRGFVWAPLLGEAVAAEIAGEPGALERVAAEALHPARFLVRALKRGECEDLGEDADRSAER